MSRRGNIDKLYELASGQWGLFTSAQATGINISRNQLTRMAHDGRIEPVVYGTYRITAGEETAHVTTKAAWLSLYPKKTAFERLSALPYDAVASGRTAACLQGFGDFYDTPFCFVVADRKRSARKELELIHAPIEERDIDLTHGIPSATPERTLADLLRLQEDPSLIDDYLEQASSSGYVFDEKRLAALLEPLHRTYGYENGKAFAGKLLNRIAVPAAFASSLGQITKVIESSAMLQDAIRMSKGVEAALHVDYAELRASADAIIRSMHVHPDTFAAISLLPEQLKAALTHIDYDALRAVAADLTALADTAKNSIEDPKGISENQFEEKGS